MKKSVTLIETLVGALILAIVFAGLLATFIGARKYVNRANKRLVASYLVRRQLVELHQAVREDTWDSGDLSEPQTNNFGGWLIDGVTYQGTPANNYQVASVAGKDYREVEVTVNYPTD